MKRFAQRYQTAWQALCILDPDGTWSTCLKELKDIDICGPGKDLNNTCSSNSRYELSWIWLVPHFTSESNNPKGGMHEEEFNDHMHVEWAKVRAHMMQWKEELLLVKEEMWQVLKYHKWKVAWWCTQGNLQTHNDATILSSVSGYAHKQAAIALCLATKCAYYWLPWLERKAITLSWAVEYVDFANPSCSFSHTGQHDGTLDLEDMTTDNEGDIDSDEGEEHPEISDEEYFLDIE